MVSILELVESKGYKNFMKYVYGWGASVVLIGALFKILHLPGSSLMLTIGLLVEAMIFFFSGFEPLHEELDWTLVYPELAGLSDEFDEDESTVRRFDRAHDMPQVVGGVVGGVIGGVVGGAGAGTGQPVEGGQQFTGGGGGGPVIIGGGSPSALARFDELLEKSEIGSEIFDKLGEGLNNLSNTAAKLADLSDASVAAKDFVEKVQGATVSVGKLDETYQKSAEVLGESVSHLSDSYSKSAETFNSTNERLSEAYTNFAEKLTQEINTIGNEGTAYTEKLGGLNSNLAALNAVYELQVNNVKGHIESSSKYYEGVGNMVNNIKETVENTNKLNEGVQELEKNISSLNSIYGNMLSSINFNK
ncbi:MAG: gliding motility protein GldL [Salinivirgaceae bacterium]|nr:gliding motility protein GldL [Salinivirgaceae bacterium]